MLHFCYENFNDTKQIIQSHRMAKRKGHKDTTMVHKTQKTTDGATRTPLKPGTSSGAPEG